MLRFVNDTKLTQPNILIWDYVKDLLMLHDCVIVPGFGGFVCNREPAKIDQVSHIITPPSRKVVFNQNLKTNDGLLAGFWSQKQQVSYTQAVTVIDECIHSIIHTLQDKKQLHIDLFGSFRLNAEANYVFLPDKRNNYLISSFGLNSIQAQPVTERTIKVLSKTKNTRPAQTKTRQKNRIALWKPVLTLLVIGLISVNGYILLNGTQHGINNTASIGSWFDSLLQEPTNKQQSSQNTIEPVTAPAPVYIPEAPAAEDTTLITDDSFVETTTIDLYAQLNGQTMHIADAKTIFYFPHIPEAVESTAEVALAIEPTIETAVSSTLPPTVQTEEAEPGYYVIGGMFCKERNARRFLKKLTESGYNEAQLLPSKNQNCQRVSYKMFTVKSEAEVYCKQIKSSANPEAWILSLH